MMGSPTVRFRSTVQGRLKSLAVMNLKILFTLMLCVALEKKRVAFIALAYALASLTMVHCISRGSWAKSSNFVPIKIGIAVLFHFLALSYQSIILVSVHRLVRSNMNRIATASLHAIGTWSTGWLSPATSQMLKASLAPRTASVLSIRFRPVICRPFCSSPCSKIPHPNSKFHRGF